MTAEVHALADTLPPLLMAAKRIAGSVIGVHGRRRAGPGDSFWQYRAARAGDCVRQIDWRQSARSQHLQVRETEWTTAQTVHLWCDDSPTLDWRSMPRLPSKSERAKVLALAISLLLLRGGERVCPFGADPIGGERQLDRLALALAAGAKPTPSPVVTAGHGVVLISDFLAPADQWRTTLKALFRQGVVGHLLQVLDPAEETFPYAGHIDFHGIDRRISVAVGRAQDVGQAYRERMRDHCQDLTRLAQSLGWTHLIHRTDHPPQTALLALYARLSERPRW